ncbi:MAG: hypothetical protein RXN89_04005 [Vulcanisaeta sp.]|uniref:hypothetical protein n=1 Tax=Vulcanisaeta sp. EB80 TaxID=1650660 RepID=UPI000AF2DBF2|nr:hypothetical protein [Vulcanisaeta sp. EB80]MCG2864416.1 hypothetical protein [Vulcanisaeta sp.]MCG2865893.1 hypothetical protein [Vulcanisaeta sp.]MCG2884871.1 hypothetical protein [Vulcanisaeta sp.]
MKFINLEVKYLDFVEPGYESKIRSIMQVLHSLAAIDRERAVRIEDLARIAGLRIEEVRSLIDKLRVLGYVNTINDSVHLTTTAIIKLSSIYC